MFTRITNPIIDIYSADTNEFVGEARFDLTAGAEAALLQMVNYNRIPGSLVLLNLDFYQPSENYIPPNLHMPVRRNGIIRALFTDLVTGDQSPIEIRFQFDARARSEGKNPYFFDSVEYSGIQLGSIREIAY